MTENQTEVTNPQKALGCYKVGILFTAILFTITGVLMLMQGNFFHTAVLIHGRFCQFSGHPILAS